MNQSDFARLHGVSRKTVTMWKSRGWLIMSGDDIDVAASNAQLEKYRKSVNRPDKQKTSAPEKKRAGQVLPAREPPEESDPSLEGLARDFLLENGAELSLDEARRVKENYLALLTKLEFQKKMANSLRWLPPRRFFSTPFANSVTPGLTGRQEWHH